MKPIFIFSILLLLAGNSFAQQLKTLFFKKNGAQVTNRDSADYIRFITNPDSASALYSVTEFYKNGNQKLIGKSTQASPIKFEGECLSFYKNGGKQRVASYKDGKLAGREMLFYPNGKVYIINTYNEGDSDSFLITACYDSLGVALAENGNGYYKEYNEGFKQIGEEGAIKDGKRDGIWRGYSIPYKVSFTENYNNGQLIDGRAIFDDGQAVTYTKMRGVPPQYKGGLEAFYKYISSNVHYPMDARKLNIQGKVIINFVLEKNGEIDDIKITQSVSPSIDEEAIRVIKESPSWTPATYFGRPVRVSYTIPLAFALAK